MGTIKWVAIAGAVLAIVGALGAFAWHYNSMRGDLETMTAERDRLTIANTELAEGLDIYKRQAEAVSDAMVEMADAAEVANDEVDRLNALFRGHDFAATAVARPGMVERRVNAGTARIFGLLEQATATDAGGD